MDLPLKSTEASSSLLNVFGGLNLADPHSPFFLNGEGDFGSGPTHYDGSTQSGVPLEDTTDNTWFDVSGKVGAKFTLDKADCKVYAGIGLYSWTRILGEDYKEVYSWWYLPIGCSVDYFFSDNFSMGLDAGIKQMLLGHMGIWFDIHSSGAADVNLILGNRTGYYCELPLKVYIDDFTLTCAPYYESRPIGRSNTGEYYIYEIYEPSSTAIIKGVKLWAGFSF